MSTESSGRRTYDHEHCDREGMTAELLIGVAFGGCAVGVLDSGSG
jgi:hypothetical protein